MKKVLFATILSLCVAQASFSQTPNKNKQIAKRYFNEVINQQNIELIPQLFAENYIYYDMHSFSETKDNVKSFQDLMKGFFKAFPDSHYSIKNMIAEGNKVYSEIVFTATHKGDFMNIPATNKSIKISEAYFFIFEKRKIIESRRLVDFSAFFEQLKP
jgi:steroid delta-isomerase-like uncharacterized protein